MKFWAWWRRELLSFLPPGLRRLLAPVRPVLEVVVEGPTLHLATVADEERREIATIPDPLGKPPAGRLRRRIARATRRAGEAVLRLPAEKVLRPTLRVPVGAVDALEETLAREMDRHTPFPASEVRHDWRVRGSDSELEQLFVDLLVARRADVDDALARVRAAGLSPDRVDGPAVEGVEFDLMRSERPPPCPSDGRSRLLHGLSAAVAFAAITLALVTVERRQADLAAVEAALAPLRATAAEVAALEERETALFAAATFLTERKRSGPPAIAVLAEVTRSLPDGDWLESLSLERDRVRIDGFTADAARLPTLLEQSEMLTDIAFAAPLQRQAELGVDRFSITASLVGAVSP